MKTAFFSDVHGNRTALDQVLRHLRAESPDRIVFLGDLATLGPSPVDCVDLLVQTKCDRILGNHDEFLLRSEAALSYTKDPSVLEAIDWCRSEVGSSRIAFIADFVPTLRIDLGAGRNALCFHGSPDSNVENLWPDEMPGAFEKWMDPSVDLFVGGHTHFASVQRWRGSILANVGSAGMPFRDFKRPGPPRLEPRCDLLIVESAKDSFDAVLRSLPLDLEGMRSEIEASDAPMKEYLRAQYRG